MPSSTPFVRNFQERNSFEETDVTASLCRQSFFDFVQEFWDVIIPEKPIWNWHIEYLCQEMQKMAEQLFRNLPKEHDLIINISPGSTKSTICSVMFPAWVWTRMPSAKCICASYTHTLAGDLSRKCRDLIKSDKYRACFKYVKIREDQDTKAYFLNTKGGNRFSTGVGGTVTGMHGHFVIVDDPLDPNRALSKAEVDAANSWMSETLPSRKVDKEVCPTILIMQRLHQNDPTGNRLDKVEAGPVRHICLPAEATRFISPPELIHKYVNKLMDPVRLSKPTLNKAHAELGEFGFAGQYLQNPVPLGGGMFKVDRLRLGFSRPGDLDWKRIIRFWDKAGSDRQGNFTVGVQMGLDKEGRFWILDVVRGQWESAEREYNIKKVAKADGRKVYIGLEQEPGSGGKHSAEISARSLPGYKVRIVKVGRNDGDKAQRADPFSVQVNAYNVYLVSALWNTTYIEELRFFPYSTYDDQVDASSGAFNLHTRPHLILGSL